MGVHQKNTVSRLADVLFQKHMFFFGLTSLLVVGNSLDHAFPSSGWMGNRRIRQILEDHVPSFVLSLFEDRLKVPLPLGNSPGWHRQVGIWKQIPFDPQQTPFVLSSLFLFFGSVESRWVILVVQIVESFIRMGTFKSHY